MQCATIGRVTIAKEAVEQGCNIAADFVFSAGSGGAEDTATYYLRQAEEAFMEPICQACSLLRNLAVLKQVGFIVFPVQGSHRRKASKARQLYRVLAVDRLPRTPRREKGETSHPEWIPSSGPTLGGWGV